MEKLKQIIDAWYEKGKIPAGFTPSSMFVLYEVYNGLKSNGQAVFIQKEVR